MVRPSVGRLLIIAVITFLAVPPAFGTDTGSTRPQVLGALKARAESGEPEAQYQLALLGIGGILGDQGRESAVELLAAAVASRHGGAHFVLGSLYTRGVIVARDVERGSRLFRAAADRGDARSQNALALLLLRGEGVAKDSIEAQRLLEIAAAGGLVEAKSNLGVLLVQDNSSPQNTARGVMLLRSVVAENPKADAFMNYGWLFDTGTGVAVDPVEAQRWYERAADLGSPRAHYNLAILALRNGDQIVALEWLMVAAAGADGDFKLKALAMIPQLAGVMAPEEVGAAGEAARERLLHYASATAAR
jgi:TPR repeat protein